VSLSVQLAVGAALSVAIALLALWRRSLSPSGALGAVVVGTVTFGLGGLSWGTALVAFFVSSSALSHYRRTAKESVAGDFAKGGERDLGQTLANGGAGALIASLAAAAPHPALLHAFAGALATVTADTWATELGVLGRRRPRLVTTWQPVEPGTSGGISLPGTLAAAAGALFIGLVLFAVEPDAAPWLVPAAAAAGLIGCTADSLLGATVQAMYWSERRAKLTERRSEPDGTSNRLVRGLSWVGNDLVNFLSSLAGAAVGAALAAWAM
jgi:uncharacterized protein (TIGR00297 family)